MPQLQTGGEGVMQGLLSPLAGGGPERRACASLAVASAPPLVCTWPTTLWQADMDVLA